MHTHDLLSVATAIVPERTAIFFDGRPLTYSQLSNTSLRLSNALAERGVVRGDRVAVIDVNTPQHFELYFAASRLDAIYVPLNFRGGGDEIGAALQHVAPKVIAAGARYTPLVDGLPQQSASVEQRLVVGGEAASGWVQYEEFLDSGDGEEQRFPEGSPDDTAALLFTAGTTGRPKAVMLSHANFTSYMLANVDPPDPDVEERTLLTLPMYHVAGLQAALTSVYAGRSIVLQRQFEPREWMALVQEQRVSRALLVPTMLKQLLDHPEFGRYDLSSLKVVTYGGAPMPVSLIERAISMLGGVRFLNAFGQTETGSTIAAVPPEDHDLTGPADVVARRRRHLSSVGLPLPDVEVRVVDEDGRQMGAGATGEIVARGPGMMSGYWREADATAGAVRDGWVYTGDLGFIDDDGYVYLRGRAKDFIKRGGEMVAPAEVEELLESCPGVAECAVVGVPDETWGERVVAVVMTEPGQAPTEETLLEACHVLARFKRPEQVVFVASLPRNELGKVLKRELREMLGGA